MSVERMHGLTDYSVKINTYLKRITTCTIHIYVGIYTVYKHERGYMCVLFILFICLFIYLFYFILFFIYIFIYLYIYIFIYLFINLFYVGIFHMSYAKCVSLCSRLQSTRCG